ncbi:MAG: hypothetical protein A2079_06060 [Geobacteraceae bacterium GWC2_48_7]|nr:MAG: hypothetical protein A2079_06060 [Geobacteraceae bacterium GWC2_48_7]
MNPRKLICLIILASVFLVNLLLPVPAHAVAQTLRVGIHNSKPMVFIDKNQIPSGLFIDIFNHIAAKEHWNVEYVHGTWQEGLERLRDDKIDLLTGIGYSAERAREFDFPREFVVMDWGLVYSKKGYGINTIIDLEGKRVSVLKGSLYTNNFLELLKQFNIKAKIIEKNDTQQIFESIDTGEADAGINSNLSGIQFEHNYDVDQTPIVFSPVKFSYAVNKDKRNDVIEALNRNLQELKSDSDSLYYRKYEQWITENRNKIPKQAWWGLAFLVFCLVSAAAFVLALRDQVRARTKELLESNRKLSEQKLLMNNVINGTTDSIFVKDTAGRYLLVNTEVARSFGKPVEEIIGQNDSKFFPLHEFEVLKKSDLKVMASSAGPLTYEEQLSTVDGKRVFQATKGPIRDESGNVTGLFGVSRDITEHRRLESQLLQAQKMESIGRLAGGIAHDFNNKLTVIFGYTELSKMKLSEGEPLWHYLNEITKAAEHSRDITAQLLSFSRQQIISPKPLNLNKAIMDTQKMLPRLIGEDILLTFDMAEDLWMVKIDITQLDQIIMNLGVNARDAMPDGGELKISTSNATIDEAYYREHLDAMLGDYVQLTFCDSGHGMDQDTVKHIFEPFFTTKEVGKGTGLGLATIYGIVAQNNGFINIYSEPGHGTVFKIFLPRLEEESLETTQEIIVPIAGSGTILLVEDDESVRQMTTSMLEKVGYDVLVAESSQAAVRLCEDRNVHIDIVLSDIIMPGMNGKDMMDKITSIRPGIKTLYTSGYSSEIISRQGLIEGNMHFIQKPFSLKVLNEKIKEVLS